MLSKPDRLMKATVALVALVLTACAAQDAGPEVRLGPDAHPTDLSCPRSSNCVNSLGGSGLPALRYAGDAAQGMALLRATLASHPEAAIVRSDPVWLEVIFTTPLGFRDQVDFVLDAESGRINFRSQSLLGRYDFGKNRSRMTAFSERFEGSMRSNLTPVRQP
ncbi:MAG TPA: DUF1499 domain-containing protein [Rhodoferax sp.]|nr:DUF1499 domain-containing protein [Rhodoferax sp.]